MANKIETGRYLELEFVQGGLNVRLTEEGRSELADLRASKPRATDDAIFVDLFEDFAGNGWQLIDPSTMGLTACRLGISPDTANDQFNVETVYWHERYAVEDAIEELAAGELFLMLAGREP